MPLSTSLAKLPFRLSADCVPTAEHWQLAAQQIDLARDWLLDQHRADGTHDAGPIFVAVGKWKVPTDPTSEGRDLVPVWVQNVVHAIWIWNPFDERGCFQVLIDFDEHVAVEGVHAVIPIKNGATPSVYDLSPLCHPGVEGGTYRTLHNPWTIWFGPPGGIGAVPHGDYFQLVATGRRL